MGLLEHTIQMRLDRWWSFGCEADKEGEVRERRRVFDLRRWRGRVIGSLPRRHWEFIGRRPRDSREDRQGLSKILLGVQVGIGKAEGKTFSKFPTVVPLVDGSCTATTLFPRYSSHLLRSYPSTYQSYQGTEEVVDRMPSFSWAPRWLLLSSQGRQKREGKHESRSLASSLRFQIVPLRSGDCAGGFSSFRSPLHLSTDLRGSLWGLDPDLASVYRFDSLAFVLLRHLKPGNLVLENCRGFSLFLHSIV
ncbi:hypothetical protein B296_00017996 [Ensete ventricosum]|uniref:Uncharacterized protein n=1 Tax=Ensete ventricosum TaxID=4639 RepID=A0A427AD74_ENSVE|nr:hypothetical protein B296_00017996 [Ensete ventricosum]